MFRAFSVGLCQILRLRLRGEILMLRGYCEKPSMTFLSVRQVQALADTPIDDSVAEHPHAQAKREMQRARACTFNWLAASQRMKENISDVEALCQATGRDFQRAWNNNPSSLFNVRVRNGAQRGPKGNYYETIYNASSHPAFERCDQERCDGVAAIRDHEELWLADEPDPGDVERPVDGINPAYDDDEQRMLIDYVSACLPQRCYSSVKAQDGEAYLVYQLLAKHTQDKLPKSYRTPLVSKWQWHVQPIEYYRDPELARLGRLPSTLATFNVRDSVHVSVSELFGYSLDNRHYVRIWQPRPRVIENFLGLFGPQPLQYRIVVGKVFHSAGVALPLCFFPLSSLLCKVALSAPLCPLTHPARSDLSSETCPVAALVDTLHSKGWNPHRGLVVHSATPDKLYDVRKLAARRAYLQSLLMLDRILGAGQGSYRSIGETESAKMRSPFW